MGFFKGGTKKKDDGDESPEDWHKRATLFKAGARLGAKPRTIAFHHDADIVCELAYDDVDKLPPGTPTVALYNISGIAARSRHGQAKHDGPAAAAKVQLSHARRVRHRVALQGRGVRRGGVRSRPPPAKATPGEDNATAENATEANATDTEATEAAKDDDKPAEAAAEPATEAAAGRAEASAWTPTPRARRRAGAQEEDAQAHAHGDAEHGGPAPVGSAALRSPARSTGSRRSPRPRRSAARARARRTTSRRPSTACATRSTTAKEIEPVSAKKRDGSIDVA